MLFATNIQIEKQIERQTNGKTDRQVGRFSNTDKTYKLKDLNKGYINKWSYMCKH